MFDTHVRKIVNKLITVSNYTDHLFDFQIHILISIQIDKGNLANISSFIFLIQRVNIRLLAVKYQ